MLYVAGFALCLVVASIVPSKGLSVFAALLHRLQAKLRRTQTVEPVQVDPGWTVVPGSDDRTFSDWIDEDDFQNPNTPHTEPSLGSHLLIELYGCNPHTLEQEDRVRLAMEDAAARSEATMVTSSFHEFKPFGVSGAVIIQESHYTIHTWPEHGYAAVDLFYCSNSVLVSQAVKALQDHFRPSRTRYLLVRRGLASEVQR